MSQISDKTRSRPRVGILTLTQSGNYGTALQAYSTLRIFQACTDDVEFGVVPTDSKSLRRRRYLRQISPRGQSFGITRTKNFIGMNRFVRQHVVDGPGYVDISERDSAISRLASEYDAFISGSDEIWNLANLGIKSLYYIPPNLGKYRASFATSANRLDMSALSADDLQVLRNSLNGYNYISVRDTNTKNFVEKNISSSVSPVEIVDPTLIYDFPELKLADSQIRARRTGGRKRILLMITNPAVAGAVISKHQHKADIDTVFVRHRGANYLAQTPWQFATVFSEYDLVVTNFFHGTCMSIRNRVPFVSFDYEPMTVRVESKIANIMRKLGLLDNYVNLAKLGMDDGKSALVDLTARILHDEQVTADFEAALSHERSVGLRVAGEISKGIVASLNGGA